MYQTKPSGFQPFQYAFFIVLILFQSLFSTVLSAEERAQRPFIVTDIPEAGLQVYVPARPKWNWETQRRRDTHAVILSTPEQYYPPTSIEIVSIADMKVQKGMLPLVALSSLKTVRKSAGSLKPTVKQKMQKASYGEIAGYEEILALSSGGQRYEARSFAGMMPSGRPVTFFTVTPEGQLNHVQPMLTKIIGNLKPLPQ